LGKNKNNLNGHLISGYHLCKTFFISSHHQDHPYTILFTIFTFLFATTNKHVKKCNDNTISTMETIQIGKKHYVGADHIIENAPVFSKGCRNGRELVKKKQLSIDQYIFARHDDKGKMKKSDGRSIKFDKIFIIDEYAKEIAELNGMKGENDGIEEAPPIIELKKKEKFKDVMGNVVDIETRGERKHDCIYFRVKDVENSFNILKLGKTLIDRRNGYEEKRDFKYFICKRNRNAKKELFITLRGMRRLVEVNRKKMSAKTKTTIHKWLDQFDTTKLKNYQLNIKHDVIIGKHGIVYCITSKLINCVKIGFWRGSVKCLLERYKTYYGNNMIIHTIMTADAHSLERQCHKHFARYRLENELFDYSHFDDYVKYLEANKKEPIIEETKNNCCDELDFVYMDEPKNNDDMIKEIECLKFKNLQKDMEIEQLKKRLSLLES